MASGTSGTCVQIAAKLQNNGYMMTRRCSGGIWSSWESLHDSKVQEGTWTPIFPRSGGVSITTADYRKSGHVVSLDARITITAGAEANNPYMADTSLPFSPARLGAISGVIRTSDNHSYNMAAVTGNNNNVWVMDATSTTLSGDVQINIMYITNS